MKYRRLNKKTKTRKKKQKGINRKTKQYKGGTKKYKVKSPTVSRSTIGKKSSSSNRTRKLLKDAVLNNAMLAEVGTRVFQTIPSKEVLKSRMGVRNVTNIPFKVKNKHFPHGISLKYDKEDMLKRYEGAWERFYDNRDEVLDNDGNPRSMKEGEISDDDDQPSY